jgi:hypothetical protein
MTALKLRQEMRQYIETAGSCATWYSQTDVLFFWYELPVGYTFDLRKVFRKLEETIAGMEKLKQG